MLTIILSNACFTISYDYKYIDYFKSEAKALSYYKKHINESKIELTFEDIYISLINSKKISNKDIQYSNPFTIDEINKMCSDYYDDFVYGIIMFMIHTGIKTYTLFKIKIKDIDINSFRINATNVSIQNQIIIDDISKETLIKYYSIEKEFLFELNDKEIEYTVYKRYNFIPFINHYGFNHEPQNYMLHI